MGCEQEKQEQEQEQEEEAPSRRGDRSISVGFT